MRANPFPSTAVPEERPRRALWSLSGIMLGLGAPAGLLALRRAAGSRRGILAEIRSDRVLYAYVTGATCAAFGAFAWILGTQEDRIARKRIALDRTRREFAAIIAGELAGPLQVLLLQAEFLQRSGGEKLLRVPKTVVDRMQAAVHRLVGLVEDLLDTSHLDANRLAIRPEPIRVITRVEEIAREVEPEVERPVHVEREGWPGPILADPAHFRRVLSALVENAARHSPPGAPVHIQVRPSLEGTEIAVHDEGPGMKAEEIERLFDPLLTAETPFPAGEGLGLRLLVVKRLVEAHGGELRAESSPGHGTTLTTVWPAAPEPAEPPAPHAVS